MSAYKFSRRSLLASTGVPAALLPLLNSQAKVWGAGPAFPKRLVILQWTNGVMHDGFWPITFNFLGIDPKQAPLAGFGERSHHDIAHNPGPNGGEQKRRVDKWFVQQFADFITKLKARPEGNGTMLDNTLIVFINNFSEGGSHSYDGMPIILAGSCGGAIETGRFVRAPGWDSQRWWEKCIPHNGLLAAIGKAMGATLPMKDGQEYFGDPRYGGVMPGILRS